MGDRDVGWGPMVRAHCGEFVIFGGVQGPLAAEIWDQGDAVACWSGEKMAAVVFPIADSVDR